MFTPRDSSWRSLFHWQIMYAIPSEGAASVISPDHHLLVDAQRAQLNMLLDGLLHGIQLILKIPVPAKRNIGCTQTVQTRKLKHQPTYMWMDWMSFLQVGVGKFRNDSNFSVVGGKKTDLPSSPLCLAASRTVPP